MDSEIVDEETGVKHWQLIPKGMVRKVTKIMEVKNGNNKNKKR